MSTDRLKWLRIEGFRSIEKLTLPLDGLQVLIGENGSGKSTILEAFELLSKTVTSAHFPIDFARRHGEIGQLKRLGAEALTLTACLSLGEDEAEYSVSLTESGGPVPTVSRERFSFGFEYLNRAGGTTRILDGQTKGLYKEVPVPADSLGLPTVWGLEAPEPVLRARKVLSEIRVHVPMQTSPTWGRSEVREATGPRAVVQLGPGDRLDRGGGNLTSVFHRLKNSPRHQWQEVLRDVRAGLGGDIADVVVDVKAVGGYGELQLVFEQLGPVPASQLSDGQLSYLALVAMAHLREPEALLLFDEPELHLHPALLARATWLFERIAKEHPVVLSTHADAVLDALDSEMESVRVVELDVQRRTVLRRLSQERLDVWKNQFSSVSELRREGLLNDVVEVGQ